MLRNTKVQFLATINILLFVFGSFEVEAFTANTSNPYFITRDQYIINPQYLDEAAIQVCNGIDMSDPNQPKRRSGVGLPPLKDCGGSLKSVPTEDYTIDENFQLIKATTVEEEFKTLSTYFKGAYRFASLEAAYDTAKKETKSSTSIYAVLDSTGYTQSISSSGWDPEVRPLFEEQQMDPAEMRRQFLLDYGSHYVSSVTYGYKLAIRGKITNSTSDETSTITGHFNAAFVTGSADVEATNKLKTASQNNQLELTFAATSGGLYREGEERPAIVTSIDEIIETFKDLRNGELKVRAAPVSAVVKTYWNVLPFDYKKSRSMLKRTNDFAQPDAVFGVPTGTIVAWHPTKDFIKESTVEPPYGGTEIKRLIVPPEGWALCDGNNGTPNLLNRFIRGVMSYEAIGPQEAVAHTHVVTSSGNSIFRYSSAKNYQDKSKVGDTKLKAIAAASHKHGVSAVKSSEGLPAHYTLVYIMKLK